MRVPQSLRVRLLLATITVALITLVAADIAVYTSLRSFLYQQVDSSLASSQHALRATLAGAPPGVGEANPPPSSGILPGQNGIGSGLPRSNFCATAEQTAPGMFVEVRAQSGVAKAAQTCVAYSVGGASESPRVPKTLELHQVRGDPPAVEYLTTSSSAVSGPAFELLATELSPSSVLVIAAPINSLLSTLRHLLWIEIAVTSAALLAALGFGWWLVRLGFRPLREVERTAIAITAGDLTSRVPIASERSEVGRVATALNTMLEQINAAFAARDETEDVLRRSEARLRQFVADASHELRTPIAAVSAYAQLVKRGALEHENDLQRVIAGIASATDRMKRLVEDLLVLARYDEHLSASTERVELVGLVAEAIDTAGTVGPQWPIELRAFDSVEIEGDAKGLRQMIDNLLANVRAHTPAGTRTIVEVHQDDSVAVVEVIDDGPGLSPDSEALVFERFVHADSSRSRETGGSGLGLSIVKSIVVAHHGHVEALAHDGGAHFRLTLPAIEPESDEPP